MFIPEILGNIAVPILIYSSYFDQVIEAINRLEFTAAPNHYFSVAAVAELISSASWIAAIGVPDSSYQSSILNTAHNLSQLAALNHADHSLHWWPSNHAPLQVLRKVLYLPIIKCWYKLVRFKQPCQNFNLIWMHWRFKYRFQQMNWVKTSWKIVWDIIGKRFHETNLVWHRIVVVGAPLA